MKPGIFPVTNDCTPVREIVERIGDRWSLSVVRTLGMRKMRFSELRRSLGGISQKVMTSTLRGLERDGLVRRTQFPTIPPSVEYELTDLGRDLWVPVSALGQWAHQNRARIEAARVGYDERLASRREHG